MKIKNPKRSGIILIALAVISAALRLYINYSTEFMPGAVGAFYLVQVRSIIETGSLAFKEFPLLFYLEAIPAKLFVLFLSMDLSTAVNHASRIFDAVVPPLSIFPAYFIVRKMISGVRNNWIVILFSAVSIFYISFFTLVSDYQKNSLGLLWLFFLFLFVYKSFHEKKLKEYFLAFVFFALTGITHFGCFAVSLFFLSTLFAVKYFKSFSMKRLFRFVVELTVVLILGLGTIYYFGPERFILLVNFPAEVFNNPIIFSIFKKNPAISTIDLINITIINITAMCGLVVFIRHKNKIESINKTFVLSSIIMCLVFTSPFLGVEWGQRLYLISYVFVLPVIIFLYSNIKQNNLKNLVAIIVFIVLAGSFTIAASTPQVSNMNKEGYKELLEMKNKISSKGSSLIVVRLGLNYWVSWTLRTMAAQEVDIRKHWWGSIDNIYFLKQVKGRVPFGTAGLYGRTFSDPKIPEESEIVFKGEYYFLFRIDKPPSYISK